MFNIIFRKRKEKFGSLFSFLLSKNGKKVSRRSKRKGVEKVPGEDFLTTRLDVIDTVMLKARARACSERGSKRIANLPASSAPML